MGAHASRRGRAAQRVARRRGGWGEALPRAQQVSCLWHWPAAPCSSATPSTGPLYCVRIAHQATTVRHGPPMDAWVRLHAAVQPSFPRTKLFSCQSAAETVASYMPVTRPDASEHDDYESAGPGANSRSSRSRVRTHLDIGCNGGLQSSRFRRAE
jgi:hypothetical protein